MASGRMILFLVFLFIVPAQAPESCSSLSCDDGPIADMRECFLGGAGELAPSMKRTMDAASNSILFFFNNMFVQATLTLFQDEGSKQASKMVQ
jgi:hypothetical protein